MVSAEAGIEVSGAGVKKGKSVSVADSSATDVFVGAASTSPFTGTPSFMGVETGKAVAGTTTTTSVAVCVAVAVGGTEEDVGVASVGVDVAVGGIGNTVGGVRAASKAVVTAMIVCASVWAVRLSALASTFNASNSCRHSKRKGARSLVGRALTAISAALVFSMISIINA